MDRMRPEMEEEGIRHRETPWPVPVSIVRSWPHYNRPTTFQEQAVSRWYNALKEIVNSPVDDQAGEPGERLAEAAAVLLLEMAATDSHMKPAELDAVHEAMKRAFGMDTEAIEEVVGEARTLQHQSVSLHRFTESLRTGMDNEARYGLIEHLWRVAYADGHLDRYEEQLLRRLADLLGVPHAEFIRTKLKVAGTE